MTTPTDDQLKIALAGELPELISFSHKGSPVTPFHSGLQYPSEKDYFYWKDSGQAVTEKEWLWIVAECEKKLNEKQQVWYLQKLSQGRFRDGDRGTIGCIVDRAVFATWQQRAIAYFKTIGKEI